MKQDYTHITMVLDRSGSMQQVKLDTIGGVNAFMEAQAKAPGQCSVTLLQFDDELEYVYRHADVKSVPPLTKDTYIPRNTTALLDAIGKAMTETGSFLESLQEGERPAKVICVIVTDGLENASRKYDRRRIFDMIKHQRDTYNWAFVFIGANQDAIATGQEIGISAGHSMNYAANSQGTRAAYASLGSNVIRARDGSQHVNSAMKWSDEDRRKQEEAKKGATP